VLGFGHDVMGEALGIGERHLPFEEEDPLQPQYLMAGAGQSLF
jgi:hypothetical protein